MDSVETVNQLELEERFVLPLGNAGSPAPLVSGFVDDGSLVCFTSNVTAQLKEDVLFSTLLAQLAANKKYDRFNDTENWYKFYTDVMGKVGWVLHGVAFDEYQSSQANFKISQLALETLSALIGPEAELMTVVKETLDNLAKSSEGITLFGSNSASEKHGNFQIIPCTVDKSNQVNVAFIGAYFTASEVSKNYFFDTYSREGIQLFKVANIFTFSQDLYACVRENVIKKLGNKVDIDRIKKFIDV